MKIEVDEKLIASDIKNGSHRTLVDITRQQITINGCNVLAMVGNHYQILED